MMGFAFCERCGVPIAAFGPQRLRPVPGRGGAAGQAGSGQEEDPREVTRLRVPPGRGPSTVEGASRDRKTHREMASQTRPRRGGSAGSLLHRVGNPFVRLFLRSPLHSMMSGALMLITVRGRRTGRTYTLPVQYSRAGGVIYVIPGNHERKTWWRNLIGGAPVGLRLRGKDAEASAVVFAGERDREEIEEGLRVYLARFPAAARLHGITRNADGTFDEDRLRAAADGVVMVRIVLVQPTA